ncbi:hypothetical protein RB196_32280 [Streptomyces sp. PmtA]
MSEKTPQGGERRGAVGVAPRDAAGAVGVAPRDAAGAVGGTHR